MKRQYLYFLFLLPLLLACKPKTPTHVVDAGTADFTKFIAIGDGHTAGYMDDGLSLDGQKNSLGAILQQQLMLAGAPAIEMPWMSDQNIGLNVNGLSRLILGYKTDCQGISSLSPVRVSLQGETLAFLSSAYNPSRKYSNFGVPGLRMIDMVSTAFGNINLPQYNAFFARMSKDQFNLPGSGNYSSVQENIFDGGYPTFCSIYLGIEDVLP